MFNNFNCTQLFASLSGSRLCSKLLFPRGALFFIIVWGTWCMSIFPLLTSRSGRVRVEPRGMSRTGRRSQLLRAGSVREPGGDCTMAPDPWWVPAVRGRAPKVFGGSGWVFRKRRSLGIEAEGLWGWEEEQLGPFRCWRGHWRIPPSSVFAGVTGGGDLVYP